MNERELRELFEEIYRKEGVKILPEKKLLELLIEKGFSPRQAKELYYQAYSLRIIDIGLDAELDEKTGEVRKFIVVEYMTEEDWEALRALEKVAEEEEKLKRALESE